MIIGSFLFFQEIFFFKEGSVIFWNVPELERNLVLKFLAKHSEDAYEEDIGRVAFHFFFFISNMLSQSLGTVLYLLNLHRSKRAYTV
jgi:hypothetical protein